MHHFALHNSKHITSQCNIVTVYITQVRNKIPAAMLIHVKPCLVDALVSSYGHESEQ